VLLLASCTTKKTTPKADAWHPGVAYATPNDPVYRGLLDRRGLIHAHSVHSHDACDGCPRTLPDGTCPAADYTGPTVINAACFQQFRDDLCEARMDYIFLSDHGGSFDDTEYPDAAGIARTAGNAQFLEGDNTVLYTQSRNDQLVMRGGSPVANRVSCPSGRTALIMAGNEGNNLMAVGLESHTADRSYGTSTDPNNYPGNMDAVVNTINQDRAKGAVVLVAHPEGLSEEELATFPIDGYEMYNVHANTLYTGYGLTAVTGLILNLGSGGDPTQIPTNPNLAFLAFVNEDPKYLTRWAYTASRGVKRVMTMGSDCHQNVIQAIMSDGMRGDRYQRVMRWFTNHLLVTPNADGSWDDAGLKAALKNRRLYGAVEVLGYPVGFDYHASTASSTIEMGGEVALSSAPVLSVKRPTIEKLDATREPPVLTARILRADGENWVEVAIGAGDLSYMPAKAGAYRAEVRMVPNHLREEMGPVADQYLSHDYVWIYSNSIYVN
jgi:hypothetical protein